MRKLDLKNFKSLLLKRQRSASKSDYGHVLVIGGDYGMGGAARMAAEAAMRMGAGLASVATRPEHISLVSSCRPEIMCHAVRTPEELRPLMARATVLIIGPGLGKSDWSRGLLEIALTSNLPKIIDADGLNLLSEEKPIPSESSWILTPHPGEAARLLGCDIATVQNDRLAAVKKLHEIYGGVIVLKGAGTLIQSHEGDVAICESGNPGMASGGMGDVLSGVIAGLAAQKIPLASAAELGVLLHAMAGDKAAAEHGERGLLATDLFPYLRALVNWSQN